MKKRSVLLLACLATAPAVVLGLGFCFHTSYEPAVFGKYDTRYAMFLGAWMILVIPGVFLLARFTFDTQQIVLTSGRRILVRPRVKLALLVVLALLGYATLELSIRAGAARRTTTFHADVFHPYLQNTPNPASRKLAVNSHGFRGGQISGPKPPGTFRIFVFGGSTVFCGTLRIEEMHTGRLQAMLAATHPGVHVDVQNAGADWHTTQHSVMKLLFTVQDLEPDLVIMYHGINDLNRSFVPDAYAAGAYRSDYGHYHGALANLVDPARARRTAARIYLGYWFSDFRYDVVPVLGPHGRGINGRRVMFVPKARETNVTTWPSLSAFERNLRSFVRIAHDRGIPVILATQPSLYRNDLDEHARSLLWFAAAQQQNGVKPSLASMVEGMRRFNAVTAGVARELGTDLVDLDAAMPKTLEYFYDDVHNNVAGNELIATAFHDHIERQELIPVKTSSGEAK